MAYNDWILDRSAFVADIDKLCHSLGAPFSRQFMEQIVAAYDEHLDNSIIWLRSTSKPADAVNFRIAWPGKYVDTTAIASHAGWISTDEPLAKLVRTWSSRGNTEQWCDFDPSQGETKTWVWFRYIQPLADVLSTPDLPAAVTARLPNLQAVGGLDQVTFTAVDYHSQTMNIYFLVPEALTFERAASYTALAGSLPPSNAEFESMKDYMEPMFTFAVTISYNTGDISRVAFYPAVKDTTDFSPPNERLRKFFDEASCYAPEKLNIVSWSYGAGDAHYMKGETSYAGDLKQLGLHMFAGWADGDR